jgi:hypothetical protein
MGLSASQYVFNIQALVLGCLMLVACVVIQASFVFLVVSKGKRSIKNLRRAENDFQAQGVFIACVLILLSSHLIQIYVWGYALHSYDIIANQHQAMVYAGSTYTTVGFITDPLPTQWQLLSVIMATSGLFTFGWSTAVMFILSQALFPAEK